MATRSIPERSFSFEREGDGRTVGVPHRASGWRGLLLRTGHNTVVLVVTVLSMAVSVLATTLSMWAWGAIHELAKALPVAVVVPLIVAPLVSHWLVSLLHELEGMRADLQQSAIHDGLTGAYNRCFFMARLEVETERARRESTPLSVVMIDVDHFKAINDNHGHAVGDNVLEQIAQTLIAATRPYDLVARVGGEEFVALMPQTSLAQAATVAERVRSAVENMTINTQAGLSVAITASLGISMLSETDQRSAAMLDRADQAMYRAKREGRNRCVCLPAPEAAA